MKVKITLFLFFLCLTFSKTTAQISTVGSDEFGRIFNITYDTKVANKLYAVTLGNHIVVSEDNGKTWDILYSLIYYGAEIKDMKLSFDGSSLTFSAHLPNTEVNAIMVFDIASASISKIIPLPNQKEFGYVTSYSFYNYNMDVLIVDTNFPVGFEKEGKTFYTADGGRNWDMIYYTNDNDFVFINKVAISPNNPNKIFLTRNNGKEEVDGGILISEDAGKNFEERLRGIVIDPIAFDPSDDQTIFVGTGISFGNNEENLYKSTDGGDTFNVISLKWSEATLNNITVIKFNPNNSSQLIVLEENEIAISENGGDSFENYEYANDNVDSYYYGLNATYNPFNNQELIISANYIPLFSSDAGKTFRKINSPYFVSTGFTSVFNNNTSASLYYGVQGGYVYKDLNANTEKYFDILPLNNFSNGSGNQYKLDKYTANRIFSFSSSFFGSNLNVSDDNGATKKQLISLFKNNFTALATFPNNKNKIIAAFTGYEGQETILKLIDFSDTNNIIQTDINLPTINFINGILISDTNKIIVTIGTEVYSTVDEGTTWENNSKGLEALRETDLILSLEQNPLDKNMLALSTSKGIFISEDNGLNWSQKTETLANSVAFSTEEEGVIIASTYSYINQDYTLSFSVDNGESWETINNEQLLGIKSYSNAFLFDKNNITVYISSTDIGLLEYSIDLSLLSTPDDIAESLVTLYPNPTKNNVNIHVDKTDIINVSVFSSTGKKVMEFNNKNKLDISNLATGIYSLRIQTANNNVIFKRIIKQ
ncbi:T9SS type A sorting domain-containing protein [Polaribacter sargassicola]|uniref:T9SS type A sorting domain-containing protein n=1 Tax=Polaribacter sargassicola TaxID=2836891 RepID=UPI001F36C2F9|nr:T9SS type A sorting domain-containing protein [Polaribacter sp. DS7-9]MCG1036447.1 T9SS type A sorting domain-containing protein [Polaribacter sp. DS7-9]